MKKSFEYLIFCTLLFVTLVLTNCNKEKGDPFDQFGLNIWDNNLGARIEAYFNNPTIHTGNKTIDAPKVYIDFSNGLIQAYSGNTDNSSMLEKITQKLTGSDIQWFGLGKGKIYPLDFPTTQLYNKVTDPRSYATEIMAPIEGAIKEITSSSSDALFVTDFEEYTTDGKEQFENFAKGYFIEWLSKGNSIDFFITDYQENTRDRRTVDKHLYFIVFNYGKEKKLLADINYSLKDRGFNYETFSLSTDFYNLSNEYAAEKQGGNYYTAEGKDIVGSLDANQYINGLKKNNKMFEFYAFQQPWEYIYANSKSLMEPGVPVPFTDFFRKLYIDASKDDVFQLNGLEVKVYDITDDFTFFSKTQEAQDHKPKLEKDPNGNSVFAADETDPIALNCYDTNGNLLEAWTYKPKETIFLNEVFVLNEDLYNNDFKNNKSKIELGIKYHDNFNGSQIVNSNGLLRVDIIISECNPNFEKLSLFKWPSSTVKDRSNESLAESIRNTLDRVNPKGKVIYSYFIKAANQKS